jgi:hypothetical protein
MPSVPELLRHDLVAGQEVMIVLRSGVRIGGPLGPVDLAANVAAVGGWAVRIDEIAGIRTTPGAVRAA